MPRLSGFSLATVVQLVLAVGCATRKPHGLGGGFSGRQLDGNTFQIEFRGNGYTPRSTVERYLLRRAAEVTVANGFDFFIVVSGNADVRSATLNTPGSYQSTTTGFATVSGQTAFGAATTGTYTPGQTIRIMRYGATALTKTFQGEKPEELSVYDAREVLRYLGRESPVTHSGETPGLKK